MAILVLEVEHPGQRDTVVRPTAAVLDEELCLGFGRVHTGMREVVASPDEAGLGRSCIVRRECFVGVGRTFSCLYYKYRC